MNVPNKLTVSRFILTFAFLAVFFSRIRYHETIALVLFCAASLTDYFDGKIARRDNLITNFGILMDPLADKILICSAFHRIRGSRADSTSAGMDACVDGCGNCRARISHHRITPFGCVKKCRARRRALRQSTKPFRKLFASFRFWFWRATSIGAGLGNIFSYDLFGFGPWAVWFTELSKWVAVALTGYSGVDVFVEKPRAVSG